MSGIFWSEPVPPPTDFSTILFYLFIGWILIKIIEKHSDKDYSRRKKKKGEKKNLPKRSSKKVQKSTW